MIKKKKAPHLFNPCALQLVSIVGQFEILCDVVIPSRLLDFDLLRELEDLLLQLCNGLLGPLRIRGAILSRRKRTVCPARDI